MAREEGSGPEIDAREKAINDLKSVRVQTGAPARSSWCWRSADTC